MKEAEVVVSVGAEDGFAAKTPTAEGTRTKKTTPTEITPVNQNSTCEWVDESYSRRLWGQLLRRADSIPPTARRSLATVRRHALYVFRENSKGREWFVNIFVPAEANRALDLMLLRYDRNGRFKNEMCLLRLSQHAGQRLFERLRTNSVDDVFLTLCHAVFAFSRCNALTPIGFRTAEVVLPHGTLHVVADAGVWVAKTFIPAKPE
jgi:hypothetical protein